MPVATYLKDKKNKIQSKYHYVAKQFDSRYVLIQHKVTSKFHKETSEIELVRSKINQIIQNLQNLLKVKYYQQIQYLIFYNFLINYEIIFIMNILIGQEVDSVVKY